MNEEGKIVETRRRSRGGRGRARRREIAARQWRPFKVAEKRKSRSRVVHLGAEFNVRRCNEWPRSSDATDGRRWASLKVI